MAPLHRVTMRITILGAIASATFIGGAADAQQARPAATVRGVVYDSIARRTLAGATVEFVSADDPAARPFSSVSDVQGRYSVAGVPAGQYLAGFFHPALDSLGIEAAPRRVVIDGSAQRVDLAMPSARTVSASVCGPGATTDSTGLLIGHVRSAESQIPVGGASVVVEWGETVVGAQGVQQRTRQLSARAEAPGWFALCAVPSDAALQARAFSGPDSSGYVELAVPANGLKYADFFIGGAALVALAPDDTMTGRIANVETAWRGRAQLSGTVVDHNERPVANAHVLVWGTQRATTTNDRGAFVLDGLPGGTHTVEVRVIGQTPTTSTVHLAESRPAHTSINLPKPTQILSTVTVNSALVYSRNLADFDRRRRAGFGSFRTSTDIERRGKSTTLAQLLQDVFGVRVDRRGGSSIVTMQRPATTGIGRAGCIPSLFVDGIQDRMQDFDAYYADGIAGLEVYPRESTRPFEFIDPSNPCGVVVVWTRTPVVKPKK